jgi:hypothetical protein
MTLSNQQRALRCQEAISGYSDDDTHANLVDFVADAMHWCHRNGHHFRDVLDTAAMHFDAETSGDAMLEHINVSTDERNKP